MPSYNKRKEEDLRADRFESEIRSTELEQIKSRQARGEKVRLFMCSRCHRLFEVLSHVCPRCETRTMGELKQR